MNVIDMIPTGEANRISARMLRSLTGLDAAEIRRQINKARAKGVPLCSSGDGYFIADDPADVKEWDPGSASRSPLKRAWRRHWRR